MCEIDIVVLHGCVEPFEPSLIDTAYEVVESLVMGADADPALTY